MLRVTGKLNLVKAYLRSRGRLNVVNLDALLMIMPVCNGRMFVCRRRPLSFKLRRALCAAVRALAQIVQPQSESLHLSSWAAEAAEQFEGQDCDAVHVR